MRPDHYLRLATIARKMKRDVVIKKYRELIEDTTKDGYPELAMTANNSLLDYINKHYPDFITLINIYKK